MNTLKLALHSQWRLWSQRHSAWIAKTPWSGLGESRRQAPQLRRAAVLGIAISTLVPIVLMMAALCWFELSAGVTQYLAESDKTMARALTAVDDDLKGLEQDIAANFGLSNGSDSVSQCNQEARDLLTRAGLNSLLIKEFYAQTMSQGSGDSLDSEVCGAMGAIRAKWPAPATASGLSILPTQSLRPGVVVMRSEHGKTLIASIEPKQLTDRLPNSMNGIRIVLKTHNGQVLTVFGSEPSNANSDVIDQPIRLMRPMRRSLAQWPIVMEATIGTELLLRTVLGQWAAILVTWILASLVIVLLLNYFQVRQSSRALRLRRALKKRRFAPVVQPIVHATTGQCLGIEVLMRWKHPSRGLIPPAEFIDYAERSGLIVPMSDLLMRQACRQLAEVAVQYPSLYFSFNVTPAQLRLPGFSNTLLEIFNSKPIGPDRVLLELTERDLVDGFIRDEMHRLRGLGFRLAIDDFGTGQSSLALLQDLAIDRLKIDRAFVNTISESQAGQPVLDAIIQLAQRMNLSMVAEGIEAQLQADYLRDKGVQALQGYLFAKPLTPPDFATWLHNGGQVAVASLATTDLLTIPLVDVMNALENERALLVSNRWYRLRRYSDCLLGNELISRLAALYRCSRAEALALGQRLVARGLLTHVMEEHDLEDAPLFYRLGRADAVSELSRLSSTVTRESPDSQQVIAQLQGPHGVRPGKRFRGMLMFEGVVSGAEIVACLARLNGVPRDQASVLGTHLMRTGNLRHVFDERGFVDSKREHYHFVR